MYNKVKLINTDDKPITFLDALKLSELDLLRLKITIEDPFEKDYQLHHLIRSIKKKLLLVYKIKQQHYLSINETEYQFVFSLLTKKFIPNNMSWDMFYFKENKKCFNYECEDHHIGVVLDTMAYDLYNLLVNLDHVCMFSNGVRSWLNSYEINEIAQSLEVQRIERDRHEETRKIRTAQKSKEMDLLYTKYNLAKLSIGLLSIGLLFSIFK